MSRKSKIPEHHRQALESLGRNRLRELTTGLEVEGDRRALANHVDALLHQVGFAAVLEQLKRDELKAMCEALGLDATGREKALLVERLIAGRTGEGAADRGAARWEIAVAPAAARPEAPAEKLTREQLEGYLWSAADILRGSIDSSDYKNFIFGLLFLKRLSDRFEEECEALVAEGANPEDRDEHQFWVPKRARWPEIRKHTLGLGEVLNKATLALEEENAALEGVLAGTNYNDELKLGDARQRDSTLHRLLVHFSQIDLRNVSLSEPDMLGRAYEFLIERFADDAGKKGGEFYTPHQVVRLLVEILEPAPGMKICDPTCGSGGMLIQCAQYLRERFSGTRNFSLFGQEKNLGTWAICKMNLLLHGLVDARVEKGDTLRDPKLVEDGELMLFDRVIANPPFSLDAWGHEVAGADGFGRFRFGLPPKSKGDLAFVQHMVATLNVHGRLGVVMPHGVLFRGASEGRIRQGMLEEDLVEAVVGLPPNLFYGTGIPAAILVMNRSKAEGRRGKVLFVEASREFREGTNQNFLRDEDVARIARAVREFRDVERYARVVGLEEIAKNDYNLNISRYVETAEPFPCQSTTLYGATMLCKPPHFFLPADANASNTMKLDPNKAQLTHGLL